LRNPAVEKKIGEVNTKRALQPSNRICNVGINVPKYFFEESNESFHADIRRVNSTLVRRKLS
jgi:hypothetical protein